MKLQASSAYRYNNCPGSVHLVDRCSPAELTANTSSPAATFGTICHMIAEKKLTGKNIRLVKEIEKAFDDDDQRDRAMLAIEQYVETIKKIQKKIGGTLSIEEKVRRTVNGVEIVAKCDAVIFSPTETHIFDLKTGFVDAGDSGLDQLRFAAVVLDPMAPVHLHIVQLGQYDPTRRYVEETVDIVESAERMIERMSSSHDKSLGPWCAYCPAQLVCQERQEELNMVKDLQVVDTLSGEKLEEIFLAKDRVSGLMKAVEEKIRERLAAGETVGNLHLKPGFGHRRWIDAETAASAFASLGDDAYDKKLKSPAQMEKIAGKDVVAPLVEKPQTLKIAVRSSENPFLEVE